MSTASDDDDDDGPFDPMANAAGRWRWLDADGAPFDGATDRALTTYVAKLVFHPARIAPFTGPLAGTNDPLFWPSHANYERPWAYLRARSADAERGASAIDAALDTSVRFNDTWDFLDADDSASNGGCWGYPLDARLPFSDLFGEGVIEGGASDDDDDASAAANTAAFRAARAELISFVALDTSDSDAQAAAGDADAAADGGEPTESADEVEGSDGGMGSTGGAVAHRTYGDAHDAPVASGGYSNAELLAALHPHNPSLPFVYASFAWDHCSAE